MDMDKEDKQSLEAFLNKYELEPELKDKDIYVEGITDKLFLEWFLENRGIKDVVVYEVDGINIPEQKLVDLKLNTTSNRSRVIALALEIQSQIPSHYSGITCIADKDFDFLLERDYQCEFLLFTDYSCLEMYLFDEDVIHKFLRLSVRLDYPSATEIINKIPKVLEELFIIRAANEALKLEISGLKNMVSSYCKRKKNEIELDINKVISGLLSHENNDKMRQNKAEFLDKLEELRQKKIHEIRYKIHGHDFTELFCWYIKHYLRNDLKGSYNAAILEGALLGCVDAEKLAKEDLFKKLLIRLKK